MAAKTIFHDCYECAKETNNDVLFKFHQVEDIFDDNDKLVETFKYNYYTVQCRGCDYVHFIHEVTTNVDGQLITFRDSYPDSLANDKFNERFFLSFEESKRLPTLIRNLYKEIEDTFSKGTPILSGIGLRTLLESICIHQEIQGRNLKDKIDNLHKGGLIAAKDLPVLHNLREIGNVTVHQIKKPNQKTLDYSLEILNHTLKSLYIIPSLHARIRKTTFRQ